ncbi:MAG: acyl-CoA dehydrogenase [Deltaproteobacteria bacterium]|nr:acyl-CoA dehydrogenase [Deltaproteobacteria bacterium]
MNSSSDDETDGSATERGRSALTAWTLAQPTDLFADDAAFGVLVEAHDLGGRRDRLHAAGRVVAGPLDRVVRINNLHRNLPVLDDYDGVGNFTARIAHHPSWWAAGRYIYGTGIMAAYGESVTPHRYILSLFYLTAQAGEGGHNCPLACAAGAIRTLQMLGTEAQQAGPLQRLLDPNFDTNWTASQFLTEVQGGSDVGANALQATPVDPPEVAAEPGGRWRLDGEKWFCSNADADVFLVTARVAPPKTGTRGLGLFVVPRLLADGTPNGFSVRRLKDKLGTRSMASGEIDFKGAQAEALGPVDRGFKSVIELVITTSRLYNAMGCAAHARRAWVVASTYAQHRTAFGQPIGRFAQVRETLAWMRADAEACLAGTLLLAGIQESIDQATVTDVERAFFRVAVNLNKLRTAVVAHDTVNRGIEVLGGNGAIESFSILPRLLRDNVVYENWEGSHNVLRAQVLRDCRRYGLHRGFFAFLRERLPADVEALDADEAAMDALLQAPSELSDLRFRRLADRMATWVMLAGLGVSPELRDGATLTRRHLRPVHIDEHYLGVLNRLQRPART